MDERRYTRKEAGELIGQAARRSATADGLTLDEIKAAAAEVGIDPDAVELAAGRTEKLTTADRMFGARRLRSEQTAVEGELTPEAAEELRTRLEAVLPWKGRWTVSGNDLTWVQDDHPPAKLTVTSSGGTTSVRLSQQWQRWPWALAVLGSFATLAAGTGLGLGVLGIDPITLAGALGAGVLGLGSISHITTRVLGKQGEHELAELFRDVVAQVRKSATASGERVHRAEAKTSETLEDARESQGVLPAPEVESEEVVESEVPVALEEST